MKRLIGYSFPTAAFLGLLCCLLASRASAMDEAPPSLCFVVSTSHDLTSPHMTFLVDPQHQAELREAGWAVGYCTLETLTPEKVAKFNALVVGHNPNRPFPQDVSNSIYKYVKEGGGLLIFLDPYRERVRPHLNDFLKPVGIEVLPQRIIEGDKGKMRELPLYHQAQAYLTQEIIDSPLTEGVKTLWYPRVASQPTTFCYSPEWKIVARGSKTAYSKPGIEGGVEYDSSPPIAAYRQYGSGRIVAFATDAALWTLNPYHDLWSHGFFLNEGEGRRFLLNIYQFIADPSVKGGTFGGFREDEQKGIFDISPRLKLKPRTEFRYGTFGQIRKAVIGIQTTYSGGSGTVRQFCDRGKELGYDCVVFCEDAKKLAKDAWTRYVNDCRDNTGERFVAVPGVAFTGAESGNDAIVFNLRRPWPEIPWRSGPFHTFIRIGIRNRWWSNLAQIHPDENPFPFYMHGVVNTHCLYTYEREKLEDDATEIFRKSNGDGWQLSPIVFHRIRNPQELERVKETYKTFFYSDSWGGDFKPGYTSLKRSFVSNGPLIEKFVVSGPFSGVDDLDSLVTVEMKASSEAPIRTVRLFFRHKIVRVLYPDSKEVEEKATIHSNESGPFYMELEDVRGKRAFSQSVRYPRYKFGHFIGSDRMNGYCYPSYPATPSETRQKAGGRWVKRIGSLFPGLGWGDAIRFRGGRHYDPPYGFETDFPNGGVSRIRFSPLFISEEGKEFHPTGGLYRKFIVNSTDCVVFEDSISKCRYSGMVGGKKRIGANDAAFLNATVRVVIFRWEKVMMLLIESASMLLKETDLSKSGQLNPVLLWVQANDRASAYDELIYMPERGRKERSSDVTPQGALSVARGGYVAISPHPFGVPAIYCFEAGHFASVGAFPRLMFGDLAQERSLPRGFALRKRYLFVHTPGAEDERQLLDLIYDAYGFDGIPEYKIEVTHGKLLEDTYALRLKASDHYVCCGISRAELPNPLGVRVEGINENWDGGIYDFHTRQLVKRIAIAQGTGYAAVETNRNRDLFIGSLLTATDPRIRISVLEFGPHRIRFTLHNPSEQSVEICVTTAGGLRGEFGFERRYSLKPGECTEIVEKK